MRWLTGLIAFVLLGVMGAFPAGLLSLLLFGPEVGRDIFILGAVILGAWIPLRLAFDYHFHNYSQFIKFIPPNFSYFLVLVLPLILMFVPLLWIFTGGIFVIGIIVYTLLGKSLIAGLIAALILEVFGIYREAQQVEPGKEDKFQWSFVHTHHNHGDTIVLDEEHIQRPQDEEPKITYLIEEKQDKREQ